MVAARFSSGIKFPRLRVSAEAVSIFKLFAVLYWGRMLPFIGNAY